MSLGTVPDIEKFGQFKQFLKRSEADFGEKIIVFLIDEFEELQQRVADGRMSKSVFSNIRHLMQHEQKLIFCSAARTSWRKWRRITGQFFSIPQLI